MNDFKRKFEFNTGDELKPNQVLKSEKDKVSTTSGEKSVSADYNANTLSVSTSVIEASDDITPPVQTPANIANANKNALASTAYSSHNTCSIITTSIKTNISDLRTSSLVFGLPLTMVMQRTGQPLPQKIIEAMKILRRLAPRTIGIFRKSGVKTRINRLKEAIDANEEINLHMIYTPYDIADMIKLYFRELPECLLTNRLSDILLANYDSNCFLMKFNFTLKLNTIKSGISR
jgi:hypothetical protein